MGVGLKDTRQRVAKKTQKTFNHKGHEGTQRNPENYANRGLNAEVHANLG